MSHPAIRYTVHLAEPTAHRLHICCEIDVPAAGQVLRIPTWIPGSYLIREFARHVVSVEASQGGQAITIEKIDKQSWSCTCQPGLPLTVTLQIHAWDLSVRGAHFDLQHAFFNGSAVLPEVLGQANQPCELILPAPVWPDAKPWQVFTGLDSPSPQTHLPARFTVSDYTTLLDHPVEMGEAGIYTVLPFSAAGVAHELVLRGGSPFNTQRVQYDLTRICAYIIGLFGTPAPFSRYTFLTTLTGDGYGGLEHRNSTALLASRDDLPPPDFAEAQAADEGYTRFLGLCAHEYFHAWNVKRLCDAQLIASDGSREAYTELLWFFEGFTSYYDDLSLVRSGVITEAAYVKLLEKTIQQVEGAPGQRRQSVAESSFDAWIKYYRPDDNTPNSVVSYYAKGSLIALALDLTLRQQNLTLDGWMRSLWTQFGQPGIPVQKAQLFTNLETFTGSAVGAQLNTWVSSRESLPLKPLLAAVGIQLSLEAQTGAAAWGLRTQNDNGQVRVTHVLDGSPAQLAGLSAGDHLVAIDGLKVTPGNLETRLNRSLQASGSELHYFREDRLQRVEYQGTRLSKPLQRIYLKLDAQPGKEETFSRRAKWLFPTTNQ